MPIAFRNSIGSVIAAVICFSAIGHDGGRRASYGCVGGILGSDSTVRLKTYIRSAGTYDAWLSTQEAFPISFRLVWEQGELALRDYQPSKPAAATASDAPIPTFTLVDLKNIRHITLLADLGRGQESFYGLEQIKAQLKVFRPKHGWKSRARELSGLWIYKRRIQIHAHAHGADQLYFLKELNGTEVPGTLRSHVMAGRLLTADGKTLVF